MALGLSVKVYQAYHNNDDLIYHGVTGLVFAADMSTVTLTGTAGSTNLPVASGSVLSMLPITRLEVYKTVTEFPGIGDTHTTAPGGKAYKEPGSI